MLSRVCGLILVAVGFLGRPGSGMSLSSRAPIVVPEEGTLLEGDIIMPDGPRDELQQIQLWPNRVFWYDVGDDFTSHHQQVIEDAISDLQKGSCVTLKKCTPACGNRTHVKFRNSGSTCASMVGFQPQFKEIDLFLPMPWCSIRGTIQHEVLHSLGFWHEHTRRDRDLYINVAWKNIAPGLEVNFQVRPPLEDKTSVLPYDYSSVMHYRALAFSRDTRSYTIIPKDPRAYNLMGQRWRFTELDVAKLNKLYDC